jgi:hypothetical protein
LADEWTLLYNGDDRHVPVSKGVEEDFRIVSEPLFEKFMTMYEDMVE